MKRRLIKYLVEVQAAALVTTAECQFIHSG